MEQEKQKEYVMLRESITRQMQQQNNNSTFAITVTITLLGFGLQNETIVPEFFLLPYVVLLIFAIKTYSQKKEIQRLVGYLICRHEHNNGFLWETALNEYRKRKRHNDRKGKILSLIETQEFVLMGIVCFFIYLITYLRTYGCNNIGRLLTFSIISIAVLALMAKVSANYGTFHEEKIVESEREWAQVLNELGRGYDTNE